MNKEARGQAVAEAEEIISRNRFLSLEIRTNSALVIANHLNEYVVPNLEYFGYPPDQLETYRDLALYIDQSISLPDEEASTQTRIVVSRSQVEALRNLSANSSGDINLKRFQLSDALQDIDNAYFSEYKRATSDSRISQLLGKLKGNK